MDHKAHASDTPNIAKEYLKFAAVILAVIGLAVLHAIWRGWSGLQFLDSFMGMFFLIFGSFKLVQLKEFAYGFQSYDVLARRSLAYSYLYPFLQLSFAFSYLFSASNLVVDLIVLIVALVSSVGVIQELGRGSQIRCVCLGSIIKLPLSRISIVEDFGMAIMALVMLVLR